MWLPGAPRATQRGPRRAPASSERQAGPSTEGQMRSHAGAPLRVTPASCPQPGGHPLYQSPRALELILLGPQSRRLRKAGVCRPAAHTLLVLHFLFVWKVHVLTQVTGHSRGCCPGTAEETEARGEMTGPPGHGAEASGHAPPPLDVTSFSSAGWCIPPAAPASGVVAGACSATLLRLAAFPENTVQCLPALSLSPDPALSPGMICRRTGSQAWETLLVGCGPHAHLFSTALYERRQWQLGPQELEIPRAGGQLLESSKEGLCFQEEDRAGVTSPFLMSEWLQDGPSPAQLCQGRGHGVDRAGSLSCMGSAQLVCGPARGDFLCPRSDHSEQKAFFSLEEQGRLTLRYAGLKTQDGLTGKGAVGSGQGGGHVSLFQVRAPPFGGGQPNGNAHIPSPLGGALGTFRDEILSPSALPPPSSLLPPPPSLQASLRANVGAGPSVSLRPRAPCLGRLSETREEAWLPGRLQCDPASPGNSPNLGPQRTSGNSERGTEGEGVRDASEVRLRKEGPRFILFCSGRASKRKRPCLSLSPRWHEFGSGKTPACFADVAEGAFLSASIEVTLKLLDLEAWLAQSSEKLSHAVWPLRVRSADCVLALKGAGPVRPCERERGLQWDKCADWFPCGAMGALGPSPHSQANADPVLPQEPPGLPLTLLKVVKIELGSLAGIETPEVICQVKGEGGGRLWFPYPSPQSPGWLGPAGAEHGGEGKQEGDLSDHQLVRTLEKNASFQAVIQRAGPGKSTLLWKQTDVSIEGILDSGSGRPRIKPGWAMIWVLGPSSQPTWSRGKLSGGDSRRGAGETQAKGVCQCGVRGLCEACSGRLPGTSLSSRVSGLIHSFLSPQRNPLYSSPGLTPASLSGPCTGCQLDVLGGRGPGSHLLGCQRSAAAALPSAGSPAANTWTGSPGAGQLSELWFLLRLRLWPSVEEGEPGAAGWPVGSPLGPGCGIIKAGPEEVLPGGRVRKQGTGCLAELAQLADDL
ncbi:hypothetical protein Cadr_000000616 [Camelus dromedarius]|uniref:Uncharacterized protein n=1 Tax=Camelus dromedarius TaxID=9838 RepID=A0A5N4EJK1_CAMDR|nr:hypothetical protein Cadr_000000616 [Camelus dromedarius]